MPRLKSASRRNCVVAKAYARSRVSAASALARCSALSRRWMALSSARPREADSAQMKIRLACVGLADWRVRRPVPPAYPHPGEEHLSHADLEQIHEEALRMPMVSDPAQKAELLRREQSRSSLRALRLSLR